MSVLVWNKLQLTAEDRHKHIATLTQKGKPDSAESVKSLPKWCHLSLTLQDGTHKFLVVRGKRDGRQRKFCKANKYWNWSARTGSGTERNWGMESQSGLEGLSLSLLEMGVVRSSSQKGRVNVRSETHRALCAPNSADAKWEFNRADRVHRRKWESCLQLFCSLELLVMCRNAPGFGISLFLVRSPREPRPGSKELWLFSILHTPLGHFVYWKFKSKNLTL